MKKTLQSSEWALVLSLIAIMASLVVISKVNTSRAGSMLAIKEFEKEAVLVTVTGAVSKPGSYLVPAGSTLAVALKKARPTMWADLKSLSVSQIVEAPLNIEVGELKEVIVRVEGAVIEPVQITMPVKSRVSDLLSKISLSPEADKRFFKSKRMLKNGVVIDVPKKTVVDNPVN
jgi:DNA uptake protein ComE-like DNA-binding protein